MNHNYRIEGRMDGFEVQTPDGKPVRTFNRAKNAEEAVELLQEGYNLGRSRAWSSVPSTIFVLELRTTISEKTGPEWISQRVFSTIKEANDAISHYPGREIQIIGHELPELLDVLDLMESTGGSFASSLARAWKHADLQNRLRMERAFGDLFMNYAETLVLRQRNSRKN